MGIIKERMSNLEALRLLCMLMVLNLHSFHGWTNGSGFWQAFDFFRESSSICAVDCFVLISGYFGINWKFKSFYNLVFQIFFYSIAIYVFVSSIGLLEWNNRDFFKCFGCLYNDSWGFVTGYIILYFCAPILNVFAKHSSSRELLYYLIVFFIATNFICVSLHSDPAFMFFLLYLLGRLLRKIRIERYTPSIKFWGMAYLIITVIIFVIMYFLLVKVLEITDSDRVCSFPIGFIGYSYTSPLVILQAISLFLIFFTIKF